jgi:hypothetical protein
VFKRFHRKMREQEGAIGDRKFIRLLLLHREIGMEKLTQALIDIVIRTKNLEENLSSSFKFLRHYFTNAPVSSRKVYLSAKIQRVHFCVQYFSFLSWKCVSLLHVSLLTCASRHSRAAFEIVQKCNLLVPFH